MLFNFDRIKIVKEGCEKMKLRKWVVNTLLVIIVILTCLLGSNCDSLLLFFISRVVILAIILGIVKILDKYSDLFN